MWTHNYTQETELSVEQLWQTLANVKDWPKIDQNIDYLTINEEPRKGSEFILKPKGGPKLKFEIETFEPPKSYADLCKMPGAKMKTLHTLTPIQNGTRIQVDIFITGPLSWLWGNTVGKKHASGLPEQTNKFIKASSSL